MPNPGPSFALDVELKAGDLVHIDYPLIRGSRVKEKVKKPRQRLDLKSGTYKIIEFNPDNDTYWVASGQQVTIAKRNWITHIVNREK